MVASEAEEKVNTIFSLLYSYTRIRGLYLHKCRFTRANSKAYRGNVLQLKAYVGNMR